MSKSDSILKELQDAATLHQAGNFTEAGARYQRMLKEEPQNFTAMKLLGTLHYQTGNYPEAQRLLTESIRLADFQPDAHNNLGNVLKQFGYIDKALACYDRAIAQLPTYAEAMDNRGSVLRILRRHDEAVANQLKLISMKPDFADAYHNLGLMLREMGRSEEALAALEQAVRLKPDIRHLYGDYVNMRTQLGFWEGLDNHVARLGRMIAANAKVIMPFATLSLPLSLSAQRKVAEIHANEKFPPVSPPLWNGENYNHERIRIGYFSCDLRDHALTYLMIGLFEKHDRSKFEVTAFSYGPPTSGGITERMKNSVEHFIDVYAKSEPEIAALARQKEIDIAVDLQGFTRDSRTGIFSRRPAPVQVNYLGYPATMGVPYMDYIIADTFTIPERLRAEYSEKIATMPDCYQANDDKRFLPTTPPPRAAHGLPEQGFVFCSFNNTYKILPPYFDVWMRLLKEAPGSVLWLLGNKTVQENLRREAAARGVDPSRLIFTGQIPYSEHLSRLLLADLALDTSPFNAGTTASDALWVGVPLVTCPGEAFAGRMAGSLLTALGVPELIAADLKDYEAKALALTKNPAALSALRKKIVAARTSSLLFDTEKFTRNMEVLYTKMHTRTQQGLPPEHLP